MNEKLRFFPSVNLPLKVTLSGITFPDSKYHIVRPHSDISVIEYIFGGQGYVLIDGRFTAVGKDDVYLLVAGSDHEYYADPEDPFEKVFINVGGSLARTCPSELGLPQEGIYKNSGLKDLFLKIRALATAEPREDDDAALIALFTEAVYRLGKQQSAAGKNREAAKMKTYIDGNLHRKVDNDELAKLLYRSKDYCIKCFFAAYGVTPYEYQTNAKMAAAKTMLKNTSLPIARIAAMLGYGDPQYFSGFFRKKCGIAPRDYRKDGGNCSPYTLSTKTALL